MVEGSATLALSQGSTVRAQRKRLRRTATLIPVSLRLLDTSGRHKIAERMLGILTEVSSRGFEVRVLGQAGRPLSRGLERRQKVSVSFLATELHEKVESIACELRSVKSPRGQPDAWVVELALPNLPQAIAEEMFDALGTYSPSARVQSPWVPVTAFMAGAMLTVPLALRSNDEPPVAAVAVTAPSEDTSDPNLETQLSYTTDMVNKLSDLLEEADLKIETQASELAAYEAELAELRKAPPAPSEEAEDAPDRRVYMRDVSWNDFEQVQVIRGPNSSPRLNYNRGNLELSPRSSGLSSPTSMLTRLLGAYAVRKNVDLRILGPKTLQSETAGVGVEPEEAFAIHPKSTDGPDIAFDIAHPNTLPKLLETYQRLGVPEVWVWIDKELRVFRFEGTRYRRSRTSKALPRLEIAKLTKYLARPDQTNAIREYVATLNER